MGLRLFTEDTSWEQTRKDVRYTIKNLDTRHRHQQLVKPLETLLGRWRAVDEERRAAEDELVDANAMVNALDHELDEAIYCLVSRLLKEADGDAQSPSFQAYFPEPPTEVIRLGLESEIVRTKQLFEVADERGASPEVRVILKLVGELHRRGEHALRARVDAFVAVSRAELKVQDWKESANAGRKSVANVLEAYALKNHLPRGYSESFFPPSARTTKKTKAEGA